MDESQWSQIEKIRDDAISVLEHATELARAVIELCDETLHPVPAPPGAHRKTRHLRVLPGLAAAGVLGWRLLRRPLVAATVGAVALSATAVVTVPFVTTVPRHAGGRRPSVSRSAPPRAASPSGGLRSPVVVRARASTGVTTPAAATSSAAAPRRSPSPSPSPSVLPSASPSRSPALLPTLTPSQSLITTGSGCVVILGLHICI